MFETGLAYFVNVVFVGTLGFLFCLVVGLAGRLVGYAVGQIVARLRAMRVGQGGFAWTLERKRNLDRIWKPAF
jgi:hypothetical protein